MWYFALVSLIIICICDKPDLPWCRSQTDTSDCAKCALQGQQHKEKERDAIFTPRFLLQSRTEEPGSIYPSKTSDHRKAAHLSLLNRQQRVHRGCRAETGFSNSNRISWEVRLWQHVSTCKATLTVSNSGCSETTGETTGVTASVQSPAETNHACKLDVKTTQMALLFFFLPK